MNEERLAEIKARLAAATTGPWSHFIMGEEGQPFTTIEEFRADFEKVLIKTEIHGSTDPNFHGVIGKDQDEDVTTALTGHGPTSKANAEFIAHAYQDILDLIAAIRAQAEQIKARDEKLAQAQADAAVWKGAFWQARFIHQYSHVEARKSGMVNQFWPRCLNEASIEVDRIGGKLNDAPHPGQALLDRMKELEAENERLRRLKAWLDAKEKFWQESGVPVEAWSKLRGFLNEARDAMEKP